ncbi:aldo/keto reductase [Pseudomonas aeruginosa]|uniref:aldo/keto reductase n=1 Tax=Pseudomonas aeruginosa TaxID=287 RepID=UPI00053D49BD|nr:aldo/keto reductase [Pseudomonas aeruginosa]EIU7179746.1 aldo/keto reductase [Pseudomonas aeruginosa]KRU96375.1 alcohol dehydrogenase [Pseudomonas aeruginosa]KSC68613.1 alcohol dehydrogenase [Pseudomonas aeruginosa]KSC86300.1 alcohol dehydrogenase [Pseudomonas aeruginosa]KSD03234.1 alcohol dehydrogenase [Pseudomonas aeruginosa]
MTTRKLGNSGLEIPALVFGGNVFGWTADESTSFRLLDALLDAGLNCIDTADVYSRWVPGHQGGESETLIGKWLKRTGKRDRMVIASKVGMDMGNGHKGLSAAYIEQALERSLRRLQTDYLDLYQSHTDDPHTDLEETLSTYGELIKKGKVRVIGASNYDARRLLEARQVSARLNLPSYQSLQPEYNLYDRADYETNLEPTVEELGIGVISYYSLASGFLSGKYRNQADTAVRARGEKVKGYLNERGVAILAALDEVAEQYNANPTQVALAWLIARPTVTAPIASATSLEQLDDLIAATHLKLDEQAIHRLDSASAY